jgi:hypothetical protein
LRSPDAGMSRQCSVLALPCSWPPGPSLEG